MSRENDKFMLRMPDGMRDRVKEEAERNYRSMNAEIVFQLSRVYTQPETQKADAMA
ncbi:Arc family DNA-binding protein [Agrobacterium salinitolerans]|uniref:Arc family DNA-binding protein n=1 Tax=Agrobacterium salinitolerans TaxID=1183413 RepID=UPI001C234761|nr:Arc family DNA-binding protein [Agrobacterium salinitolerans]QXC50937.1 Arc family DNA-binding protein [Agrobacterium salinitolerans]